MNIRHTSVIVGAIAIGAVAVASVLPTSATPHYDNNPATAPVPQYDYGDTSKSFLVDLQFGEASATPVKVSVGEGRSYSHLGDPPLLRLSLTDDDGAPGPSFNAWDPRWVLEETDSHGEQLIVRPGPGTLVAPFDGDLASMLVRDQRAGTDLATVDLGPAVHEFCAAHPTDPECSEADLEVTSTTASGDPLGVVGQAVPVTVGAVVANLGPDGPVDADVTQTAVASDGAIVTPATSSVDVDGLAVGTPRTLTNQYSVTCDTAGLKTVVVTTEVVPEKAKVADLVAANNERSVTFSVDCAVPVAANVKPGSLRNPLNVKEGAIPIAVLTTQAGEYGKPVAFDAATIEAATVRVGVRSALVATGTGAPEMHGKVHLEDSLELDESTRDGDDDGVVHARASQIPVQTTTTELCVRGRFGQGVGTTFFGCDHVDVVP